MGKKSLTKSTSKKKSTKKKTSNKKPTLKSLRKKDFGVWTPETLFVPEAETGAYSAPPAIDTEDSRTEEKLRTLLAKQFGPPEGQQKSAAKPGKKSAAKSGGSKKAAPKIGAKKAPAKKTLIQKDFGTWSPATLFSPAAETAAYAAPPFHEQSGTDEFRKLLFREFDLSKVTPKPPEEKKTEAPAQETEKPAEPETAEQKEPAPSEPAPAAAQEAAQQPGQAEAAAASAPPESEKPKTPESAAEAPDTDEKAKQPPKDQGGGPPEPPQPPPGGPSGPEEPPREPMLSNTLKLAIIGLALVFAFIIVASVMNSDKYYVRSTKSGVEIWKGDFAPRGEKKVVSLKDAEVPEELRNMEGPTSKRKAYSLPFDYFMQRAEKLAAKPGTPDFTAIREQLTKARKYAVTSGQVQKVENRLDHMEFTFLLNKADIAAGRDTPESCEKALQYLREAQELTSTPSQEELVIQEIRKVKAVQKSLQQQKRQKQQRSGQKAGTKTGPQQPEGQKSGQEANTRATEKSAPQQTEKNSE